MKVVFRTDASLNIGTGHVMRCLTLADALRARGASCRFVCREHPGNLLDLIRKRGYHVHALPCAQEPAVEEGAQGESRSAHGAWLGADWDTDAQQTVAALDDMPLDWLIVDHYALDARWEEVLRAHCKKLLVIDDLADRPHVCDVLLDQNLGRDAKDYDALVPDHCMRLVGPQNALLRPEFAALREYSLQRRQPPALKRVLITMGGVDQPNATGQVLEALKACPLPADCTITVVMGGQSPWLVQVRAIASGMPWPTEVRIDITDMARVMADSDLAIGAAGTTSWERCCLGLPTLLLVLAENQRAGAVALVRYGAGLLFGETGSIRQTLKPALYRMMQSAQLKNMSQLCTKITDGQGANRVATNLQTLAEIQLTAREASFSDEQLLLGWANDSSTRSNSFSPDPISPSMHHAWLTRRLKKPNESRIYIIENFSSLPIGQVRFDRNKLAYWEIDYSLAPVFRGKGLGKTVLETALNAFQNTHAGVVVVGIVKLINKPSCRIFESLNFTEIRNDEAGTVVYRKVLGDEL